ncbi:LysR family transcriptional regulator [Gordonia hydrophobica]|uniref:LysR family transcriptional regulator n=1 Tax=Gordonia hydrophobica TaxID=40516 RepID=A0ABZ2U3N0_9ACTN|nr:LysR family transcriptional regulator [Gordonia hydrophobica]MBM7367522.1 DNA-binding transcriptional LysR family regulator [Gordonia hydrophobica]
MRADDLVILLEIARCGSLTGAASALDINHATVSRRISALEAELHGSVIVRRVQGCELTELGTSLLESCEQIESAMRRVNEISRSPDSAQALSGLVRVSSTHAFGSQYIAPLLAELHSMNRNLTVELVTSTRLTAYSAGWDIEIGVGEPVVSRPGAEKLSNYRMGLYATQDYLEFHGEPKTIDDLADHSLIYYVESLLRVEDLDVILTRLDHRIQIGSTSVQAQLTATLAGGGIGLLPAFLADPEPTLRRVLWSEVATTPEFTASLAPRRLRRPATQVVMQAIREMIAEKQSELLPE